MIYFPKSILTYAFPAVFASLLITGNSALFSKQGNPPIYQANLTAVGTIPNQPSATASPKSIRLKTERDTNGNPPTAYIPQWSTEYDTISETRYCREQRQRTLRIFETVYENVPQIQTYTVQIPRQKSRTITVNRQEEYQAAVQEKFTVMVPMPQQRLV
eukprot:COSAG01_NODE_2706_length_7221_cov_1.806375_9_plen_158_part_01